MSQITESLHIRAFSGPKLEALVKDFLLEQGFEYVEPADRARVERTEPELRRIALRRDGRWWTLADSASYGRPQPGGAMEAWASHISSVTGRAVLALWTWDGEACVTATRWKRGRVKAKLELLRDAFRDEAGVPRAPAKVLWSWLTPEQRERLLTDGVKLVEPAARPDTGDADLDALLDSFDDDERAAHHELGDGDAIYVPIDTSVAALCAPVGIGDPFVDPWEPEAGDVAMVFKPSRRAR
jgi:hypothetical protein